MSLVLAGLVLADFGSGNLGLTWFPRGGEASPVETISVL
jgi:hypothetical protein